MDICLWVQMIVVIKRHANTDYRRNNTAWKLWSQTSIHAIKYM